ncbi:hypothetical protein [Bacillus massiliglaciei]|uniref:hypothetical protein n=1 Tax=Bacillus massiliglaciei TaxID=1816693 RepID=UPI000AC3147E|nr:hypothetical protein [Bacillus massiliglaciei]
MKKNSVPEIKRGQAITFRIPQDTPDHVLRQLQKLKETERRNFSSKLAEMVLQGVQRSNHQDRELVTLPLPHQLSKSQRDWLKHAHSEALLGTILYNLLSDPLRATALLTSLNGSSSIPEPEPIREIEKEPVQESAEVKDEANDELDELAFDDFTWESSESEKAEKPEKPEEQLDDLLGDFLAQMNK